QRIPEGEIRLSTELCSQVEVEQNTAYSGTGARKLRATLPGLWMSCDKPVTDDRSYIKDCGVTRRRHPFDKNNSSRREILLVGRQARFRNQRASTKRLIDAVCSNIKTRVENG